MNGANGIHSNGVNGFHHDEDEELMTNGHCNGMNILNTFSKLQSLLFEGLKFFFSNSEVHCFVKVVGRNAKATN